MHNNNQKQTSAASAYALMPPVPETLHEVHTLPRAEAKVMNQVQYLLNAGWSDRRDDLVDDKQSFEAVLFINTYLSEIIEDFHAQSVTPVEGKLKGKNCVEAVCQYLLHTRVKHLAAIDADKAYSTIRQFCTVEPILLECWRRRLKEHKHPDFSFPFVDGSGHADEFTMLVGCYYYGRYNLWNQYFQQSNRHTPHPNAFLQIACEKSDPYAWPELLKQNAADLSALCRIARGEVPESPPLTLEHFVCVVEAMLKTAENMGNHFWSPGFFSAGVILEESAVAFAKNAGQKMALEQLSISVTEDQYPLSLKLMIGAIRSYCAAWLLAEADVSVRIGEFVYPRGFFSEERAENWLELQKSIARKLESQFHLRLTKVLTDKIFSEVAEKMQPVLETLRVMKEPLEAKQDLGQRYSVSL